MSRSAGILILVGGLAAIGVIALFAVQVEANNLREETYTDKEPYNIEVQVPLKYRVIVADSWSRGCGFLWLDTCDKAIVTVVNNDTSGGS